MRGWVKPRIKAVTTTSGSSPPIISDILGDRPWLKLGMTHVDWEGHLIFMRSPPACAATRSKNTPLFLVDWSPTFQTVGRSAGSCFFSSSAIFPLHRLGLNYGLRFLRFISGASPGGVQHIISIESPKSPRSPDKASLLTNGAGGTWLMQLGFSCSQHSCHTHYPPIGAPYRPQPSAYRLRAPAASVLHPKDC